MPSAKKGLSSRQTRHGGTGSGFGFGIKLTAWYEETIGGELWLLYVMLGGFMAFNVVMIWFAFGPEVPAHLGERAAGQSVDSNSNCPFWAAQGECAHNPVYMMSNCRKSCEKRAASASAHERAPQSPPPEPASLGSVIMQPDVELTAMHGQAACAEWRTQGECEKSVPFMQLHCEGVCGFGAPDLQRHCKFWALSGECSRSPAFMLHQCKSSCQPFYNNLRVLNTSDLSEVITTGDVAVASTGDGKSILQGDARGTGEALARAAERSAPVAGDDSGSGGLEQGGGATPGKHARGVGGEAEDALPQEPVEGAGEDKASAGVGSKQEATGGEMRPRTGAHGVQDQASSELDARFARQLLQPSLCAPLVDERSDCATVVSGPKCETRDGTETLRTCFRTCAAKEPMAVLRALHKFPDRSPLQAFLGVAPVDTHGPRTTLRSACMGGQHRPAHEPPGVWRLRLLSAFGPRALSFCTPRRRQMTPRVETWTGTGSHVVTVAAKGESVARHVSVYQVADMPRVRLLANLLSDKESAAIIEAAQPYFTRSATVKGGSYRATVRNSSTAMLPTDLAVSQRLTALVAHFASMPKAHVEQLQVVRYAPGELYEAHHDFLDSCDLGVRLEGGRRATSFLIYLNNLNPGDTGGLTRFPALGLAVRPMRNAALVFDNYDAHGVEDISTSHLGEPPLRGDKYVVNVWLRTAPYRPSSFSNEHESMTVIDKH